MTTANTATGTHQDIDVRITSTSGLPLTMAGFILRALGTAYPHTQIDKPMFGETMNLRIPYEDFLNLGDDAVDLGDDLPDKDDPELVAFTHSLSPQNGAGVSPPPWLAALLTQTAEMVEHQISSDGVPNYLEIRLQAPDNGEPFTWIIGRRGRPSVHALRGQAEAKANDLHAALTEALAKLETSDTDGAMDVIRDALA